MVGYLNDEKATKEVIDSDKWLHTGDIGIITELGNLKITDRKKNIFVTSSGKNVAPQVIENELLKSKYVEQTFIIGEGREFCSALIFPNIDQINYLAKELGVNGELKDILNDQKIYKHVKHDIDYNLKTLSKFEQIRKFIFLEKPFSIEGGELSHKMSVKRHVVETKYAEQIESMYQ
jgi:long-chain acyl-CoA synthetase